MFRVILILTITLLACGPSPTSASVYVVQPDGSGDFPTIQAAIDAAIDGDIIELTDGTFRGDGNRDIDYLGKAITVRSQSGDAEACIIDCEGSARHPRRGFSFSSGEGPGSILMGLTLRGGNCGEYCDGGAILCTASSPRIVGCVIAASFAGACGGGVYCGNGSAAQFESCTFSGNGAFYNGGGAYCGNCTPSFRQCEFSGNGAQWGGGGMCCHDNGSATLTSCVFDGNHTESAGGEGGGGLECWDATVTVTDCLFIGNESRGPMGTGGGVSLDSAEDAAFSHCTFKDNTSVAGGGVFASASSPIFEDCTLSGNTAGGIGGGALCFYGGNPRVRGCTLSANGAGSGSGILCLRDCTMELGWTIVAFGIWQAEGAVQCMDAASATLSCCDLYGNEGGDWVGSISDQHETHNNISADPLFCGPGIEDFTLHANSPCAPGSNCSRIGAWPVGCADTPIEETTWGAIKEMFRR